MQIIMGRIFYNEEAQVLTLGLMSYDILTTGLDFLDTAVSII